jgi:lipopolysaccharide export system protein LptA
MLRVGVFALVTALVTPWCALAQGQHSGGKGQSFLEEHNRDRDQPIQIESNSLEVRDKSKVATFSGDVHLVQGDTTIRCQTLVVFYGAEHSTSERSASGAARTQQEGRDHSSGPVPQGSHDIRKIEARGGVTINSKDQNASGDLGVYDVKAKTITLTGNVVVSQGKNVLHGERVVVDTVTGNAHMEAGTAGNERVRALFVPNNNGESSVPSLVPSIVPNRTN